MSLHASRPRSDGAGKREEGGEGASHDARHCKASGNSASHRSASNCNSSASTPTTSTPRSKPQKRTAWPSELGIALAFDIHVQDGGINHTVCDKLRAQMHPGISEKDVRVLIANGIADHALPAWREDVRTRKLTVATGEGTVHGVHYLLKNWGLDEVPA